MEKTRRIALVTSHASRGGTLDYLSTLHKHLKGRGFDVKIVALYSGESRDESADVQILVDKERLSPIGLVTAIWRFASWALRWRPDIALGVMPLANILCAVVGKVIGVTAIATHHSPSETFGRSMRRVDRMVGCLGLYGSAICVSNAVRDSFLDYPGRYQQVLVMIRNAVVHLAPNMNRDAVRERYGLYGAGPLLIMVGRLSSQKNVLNAVAAMRLVEGAQLALVGEGRQRQEVLDLIAQHQLQDRVILLGSLARQEVANLMHACDVFVQVSEYEGFSLALLEAMSAKAVLLVSNVPSQVEAVTLDDGTIAAVLCDPFDQEDIARGLRLAAFNMETRAELAARMCSADWGSYSQKDMLASYDLQLSRLI